MSFLPTIVHPLKGLLASYDRTKAPAAQVDSNLRIFAQAMEIREQVFVVEQGVALENELDADDARSFHWVVYVNVSKTPKPFVLDSDRTPEDLAAEAAEKQKQRENENDPNRSRAVSSTRIAVGTVRLVPPPHTPHSQPAAAHGITNASTSTRKPSATFHLGDGDGSDNEAEKTQPHPRTEPGKSTINPTNEPYVKLGRLAVLKEYRGMNLGKLLLETALEFAREYPSTLVPRLGIIDRENANLAEKRRQSASAGAAGRSGSGAGAGGRPSAFVDVGPWKGLVCAHAQVHLEGTYKKWGFERDAGMGTWWEEGIEHVGMWKRLKLKEEDVFRRRSGSGNSFLNHYDGYEGGPGR